MKIDCKLVNSEKLKVEKQKKKRNKQRIEKQKPKIHELCIRVTNRKLR